MVGAMVLGVLGCGDNPSPWLTRLPAGEVPGEVVCLTNLVGECRSKAIEACERYGVGRVRFHGQHPTREEAYTSVEFTCGGAR